jgi:hypothetical protein
VENLQISIPITVAAALLAVTALWITISKLRSVDVGTVVDWVSSKYRLLSSSSDKGDGLAGLGAADSERDL